VSLPGRLARPSACRKDPVVGRNYNDDMNTSKCWAGITGDCGNPDIRSVVDSMFGQLLANDPLLPLGGPPNLQRRETKNNHPTIACQRRQNRRHYQICAQGFSGISAMMNPFAYFAAFAAGAFAASVLDRLVLRRTGNGMAREIQRGLDRRAFLLHYQPIVDLENRRCTGVEALVRWRGVNGIMVRPDQFLPFAMAHGLMTSITERVMQLIVGDLAGLLQQRRDLHVGINVPADLLGGGGIGEAAQRSGIVRFASQLMIEITEHGVVDDVGRRAVAVARAMGAKVAIDDFGTGTNGLAQLEDLEIDFIKIDQGFVKKIHSSAPGAKLVDAVVTIAKQLQVRTIAEGVETEDQVSYLQDLGVDFGQGWLFAKPMAAVELFQYLGVTAGGDRAPGTEYRPPMPGR
jgi:sensor c-di-GMP phosphodiesterase-like protein